MDRWTDGKPQVPDGGVLLIMDLMRFIGQKGIENY